MKTTDLTTCRMLLAVAHSGSFGRAAAIMGTHESTVSRRMADLEQSSGTPLFLRRTTGTELTEAGRQLVAAAEAVIAAVGTFDTTLGDLSRTVQRPVTISAPEGLSTYILAPLSSGLAPSTMPLRFPAAMPPATFLPMDSPADIEILLVQPGSPIPRSSDHITRKLGVMSFLPAASRGYLDANGSPQSLAEVAKHPILQHAIYAAAPSFRVWTDIATAKQSGPLVTVSTSSALHRVTLTGAGISLLPTFSSLLDASIVTLPFGEPLGVELWAVSLRDSLRLPTVKRAWDVLADGFRGSVWFNA